MTYRAARVPPCCQGRSHALFLVSPQPGLRVPPGSGPESPPQRGPPRAWRCPVGWALSFAADHRAGSPERVPAVIAPRYWRGSRFRPQALVPRAPVGPAPRGSGPGPPREVLPFASRVAGSTVGALRLAQQTALSLSTTSRTFNSHLWVLLNVPSPYLFAISLVVQCSGLGRIHAPFSDKSLNLSYSVAHGPGKPHVAPRRDWVPGRTHPLSRGPDPSHQPRSSGGPKPPPPTGLSPSKAGPFQVHLGNDRPVGPFRATGLSVTSPQRVAPGDSTLAC